MNFPDAAERIGARLCRDAVWSGGRCAWLTEKTGEAAKMVTKAVGPELYDGTAGIALFLHALAEASGDSIVRETAEGALAHAFDQAERIPPDIRPGFYSGWGGICWVLTLFGRHDDAARWAASLQITPRFDIMYGSAGAIPAALNAGLVELAIRHGDQLLKHVSRGAWPTLTRNARPGRPHLTGFAHGAAGISWALWKLSAATGETRFRDAAEAGFAYERSCFSPERGNWPDFRSDPPVFPIAWCHGATGIGFSRQGVAAYGNDVEAARKTVAASLRNIGAGNFSLCHGHAGNADFCNAQDALRAGIAEYEEKRLPWPCGIKGAGELPGLMLGIAGIGYTCLRFNDPARCPNILLPEIETKT